jgi:hypothetical protein
MGEKLKVCIGLLERLGYFRYRCAYSASFVFNGSTFGEHLRMGFENSISMELWDWRKDKVQKYPHIGVSQEFVQ